MSEELNYWQEMMKRRLSRRTILRTSALSGIGLAVGGAALGCGSKPTTGSTPTAVGQAKPAATVEAPEYGGVLVAHIQADAPNFDFVSNTTNTVQNPLAPVYNQLVKADPLQPDKIAADLAEKWEVSPDGKTYTFSLVKGVKFHDGKPFTSADVKATLDYIRNPPKGVVSSRKGLFAMVDDIATPDDFTVRITLKYPSASLLSNLAYGWTVIYPKHILEEKGDMKKDAIGTGPFKLKEHVRGVSIEVVKNPDYFIKGRPYLDAIKYYIIPDRATALANLRSGQLLMYSTFNSEDAKTAQKEFGDKVVIASSLGTTLKQLSFAVKRKPWDDVRVRQAVSLAIDRAEAVKVVDAGDGEVSGIMPPNTQWALPPADLEKIPGYGKDSAANIAQAKKLLAEAGYPNGFDTTLLTRQGTDYEPLSIFVNDQLTKVGINAKLDVKETAAFYAAADGRTFDLLAFKLTAAMPDPDAIFGEYDICGATRNYSDLCTKEVDDLFEKQTRALTVDERKKLVNQMEKAALQAYSRIIVVYDKNFSGWSPRLRNYVRHPNSYNNQRFQDVWLAKK